MQYQSNSQQQISLFENYSSMQALFTKYRTNSQESSMNCLNQKPNVVKSGHLYYKRSKTTVSTSAETCSIKIKQSTKSKLCFKINGQLSQESSLERDSYMDSPTLSKIEPDDDSKSLVSMLDEINQLDNKNIRLNIDQCLMYIQFAHEISRRNSHTQDPKYAETLVVILNKCLQKLFRAIQTSEDLDRVIKALKANIHKPQPIENAKASKFYASYCRKIQEFFDKQLTLMHHRAKYEAKTLKFQTQDKCTWFNQENLLFLINQIYRDKSNIIATLKDMLQTYEDILESKYNLIINQKKRYSILIKDNSIQMAIKFANFIEILSSYSQKHRIVGNLLSRQNVGFNYAQDHCSFFQAKHFRAFLSQTFINHFEHEIQLINKIKSKSKLIENLPDAIEFTATVSHRRLKYLIQLEQSLKQHMPFNQDQQDPLPVKYQQFINKNLNQFTDQQAVHQLRLKLVQKLELTQKQIKASKVYAKD